MPPTIMLLIGICTSFTKNPMNPMMRNPIPVAIAILENSEVIRRVHETRNEGDERGNLCGLVWYISSLNKLNP